MQPERQIAVIIAAYNAEATIARAIKSALAEAEVAEVIVVDDASRDGTIAAAKACDDGSGRLQILAQSPNAGPSAARNKAIDASTAPWITVLDSDDFILPGRMKGLLAAQDSADLIADDIWQVPEADIDGPHQKLIGNKLSLPTSISAEQFILSNISDIKRERAELGFIKPLMRRSLLAQYKISYKENMRLGEDYELYTRALLHGARMQLLPAQGYVSVMRPNSLSARHSAHDLQQLRDCGTDLSAIKGLGADTAKALRKHYHSIDCRLQWRLLINAVKQHKPVAALKCFLRPWPVQAYLLRNLYEQFVIRVIHRQRPR